MKSSLIDKIFFWNRELHSCIGLFLLLFIWLFSFSGLLLNHGQWKFSSFWEKRKESEINGSIDSAATVDNISIVPWLSRRIETGEISNVRKDTDFVDFRISRPGIIKDVHADLKNKSVKQKIIEFNIWGRLRALHTFNGRNRNDPRIIPNWIITKVWVFAMNGIAAGLIFICISSWLMWYEVRRKFSLGPLFLAAGFAVAIWFVFLVRLF